MVVPEARPLPEEGAKALPAADGAVVMPFVPARVIGDLGRSETKLTPRAVRRIHGSLPVPVEQRILWADVTFGTRPHGLVLTDVGVVIKDGPSFSDDEGDAPGAAGEERAESFETEGLGYRYIRWENFDPARVSHVDGRPTLDGDAFNDGDSFKRFAMACVRVTNDRVRARKAGRRFSSRTGLLGGDCAVRSVCRSSARATADWCFDADGTYKFLDGADRPVALEVPADQYDAVLHRVRRRIEGGGVPGVDDPDAVGALVRCGEYTYLQAFNVASTGRVPGVEVRESTGSVVCLDRRGLGARLGLWLQMRARLGAGMLDTRQERKDMIAGAVGGQLADGAAAIAAQSRDAGASTGEQAARFIADNAVSRAGYTIGATGARVILGAVGMAGGPLGMAAGLALGEACGKAGMEAFSMARDLFFEPQSAIMTRLLDGVLSNVAFEHALTLTEQALLAELMAHADPALFQMLGAALRESPAQEYEMRRAILPMVEAIRRA